MNRHGKGVNDSGVFWKMIVVKIATFNGDVAIFAETPLHNERENGINF